MRRATTAAIAAVCMAVPGVALAGMPEEDPSDGNGANGSAACYGLSEAGEAVATSPEASESAQPALDLAASITGSGGESEDGCERPGESGDAGGDAGGDARGDAGGEHRESGAGHRP